MNPYFYKLRTLIMALALILSIGLINPGIAQTQQKAQLGIQLYTLRAEVPKDVKGTLEKVAKAGYKQVELYGFSTQNQFWGLSPAELKKILDDNQLKAVSGHFNLNSYLKDGDQASLTAIIDAARTLQMEYVTIPSLPLELRKTAEDYITISKKLNEVGLQCQKAGLKLAYHNHNFEFEKFGNQTGYDIMLQHTDKKLVSFEMDLYWVVRSGVDPLSLINANKGRFPMWHIKDMDKADPKLNTEIGNGSIDFKTLYKSRKTSGAKYFFLEQENNYKPDPITSITNSAQYITDQIFTTK